LISSYQKQKQTWLRNTENSLTLLKNKFKRIAKYRWQKINDKPRRVKVDEEEAEDEEEEEIIWDPASITCLFVPVTLATLATQQHAISFTCRRPDPNSTTTTRFHQVIKNVGDARQSILVYMANPVFATRHCLQTAVDFGNKNRSLVTLIRSPSDAVPSEVSSEKMSGEGTSRRFSKEDSGKVLLTPCGSPRNDEYSSDDCLASCILFAFSWISSKEALRTCLGTSRLLWVFISLAVGVCERG
ncbi:unnamed protein product, partial [Acanthoscelides obtectus]